MNGIYKCSQFKRVVMQRQALREVKVTDQNQKKKKNHQRPLKLQKAAAATDFS